MKKKNISFILFAVAALNLLTIPILPLIITPLYERIGMPPSVSSFGLTIVAVTSLIPVFILVIVGIILLIKFRKE